MARYTYDLVLNKPEDFVQFVVNDFCRKIGSSRQIITAKQFTGQETPWWRATSI